MDRQLKNKIYYFLEEFYKVFDIQNNNNFFTFTGTNGKTTSAYLCHQLLVNEGYESIYIGTLGTQYNNTEFNNSISSKTTPDIFELFEIFKFYNFSDSVSILSHSRYRYFFVKQVKILKCDVVGLQEWSLVPPGGPRRLPDNFCFF